MYIGLMANVYDFYNAALYAIDQLALGHTLTQACDMARISVASFEKHINADDNLRQLFEEAERRGHDALTSALLHIDNHTVYGQSNPQMAKVMSDNIKWYLSKKDPKRFGDRVQVEHSVTLDRAITDALNSARNRVAGALPAPNVIDIIPTIVEDEDDLSFTY